jgi:predicted RNase H-like nuclease (RuvC/YqgF family)
MDDMVLKELNAIEKLLKSYEMVNSSLENRVRILEFSLKKLKEEISNLKSNGLKDEELKND